MQGDRKIKQDSVVAWLSQHYCGMFGDQCWQKPYPGDIGLERGPPLESRVPAATKTADAFDPLKKLPVIQATAP